MAAKRQSFLDKLERELPEAAKPVAETQPAAAPAALAAKPSAKPSAKPLTRAAITKSTVYIPEAVHSRLREIAYTERRKVHDLIMEGLDRVMENRGHPERTSDSKSS